MPRGWLKHKSKRVGRKVSRGGSSHFQMKQKARSCPADDESPVLKPIGTARHSRKATNHNNFDDDYFTYFDGNYGDFNDNNECVTASNAGTGRIHHTETKFIAAECPICCETRPLVALMKKCNHPPACRECLHEMYVTQAQKDVKNYPLECYFPSCKKSISAPVLKNRSIFDTEHELKKHHRLTNLAKAYRGSGKIVHCPHCDCPREVYRDMNVKCGQCRTRFEAHYEAHNKMTTIYAIEEFSRDSAGLNRGWAHCPRCKITISKGDGCNHMTCPCGKEFYWDEEIKKNEAFLKSQLHSATIMRL